MSINDASPSEWDRARQHYLDTLEEHDIVCAPREQDNMVQKPPHYNKGGIECIEYIRQQLGECYVEYCEGNVIKYLHRWRYKNGTEDLEKAQWYLAEMLEAAKEQE